MLSKLSETSVELSEVIVDLVYFRSLSLHLSVELTLYRSDNFIELSLSTSLVITYSFAFNRSLRKLLSFSESVSHALRFGIVLEELIVCSLESIDAFLGSLFSLHFSVQLSDSSLESINVSCWNRSDERVHLVELTFVNTEFRSVEVSVAVRLVAIVHTSHYFQTEVLVTSRYAEESITSSILLGSVVYSDVIRIGEVSNSERIPTFVGLPSVEVHDRVTTVISSFVAIGIELVSLILAESSIVLSTPESNLSRSTVVVDATIRVDTLHPLEEEIFLRFVELELEIVSTLPSAFTTMP